MGFLSMAGLMTIEAHENVKAKNVGLEADVSNLRSNLESANASIVKIGAERNKFRDQVTDTCARAEKAEKERDEARAAYDNEHADLRNAIETIKGLRAQVEAAQQVIEQHKADVSELATFRAARDRDNELRRQRREKAKPAAPAKDAAKAKPAKKGAR